jgi:hypothetical protein
MGAPPDDVAAVLRDFETQRREGEELVEGMPEPAFHWRPDGRTWSVGQCLDHLAVANRVYLEAFARGTAAASPVPREGPIAPSLMGRFFIHSLEPPVRKRFRMRAPAKIVPGPVRPSAEVLAAFAASLEAACRFAVAHAEHDLNRLTFPNPFIRGVRMGVGTGLLVMTAHNRRHLWQARNVRERPDWPGRA